MSTTTTFSGIILLLLCGEVIVPNSSATTQDTLLFQKLQTSQQDETARLAGTWQKKEGADFERATAPFSEVDPQLWK